MKVKVFSGRALDAALMEKWVELQSRNADLRSPFFSPAFTECAAAVFEHVEIAVVETRSEPIAIFPYERTSSGVAIPVGRNMSDYHGLISETGSKCSAQRLLRKCKLKRWNYDHLPLNQTSIFGNSQSTDVSPLIDLSNGFNAYVQERQSAGSDVFRQYRSRLGRLEREMGAIRFIAREVDGSLLKKILAWKSAQYQRTGLEDLFEKQWARELVHRIHNSRKVDFAGMLSVLYAGNHLVAGHFGMRSKTVWHWWFPAYDQHMAKYSPGLILLVKMAESAAELGLSEIDLGKGLSTFKARLMNSTAVVAKGSVVRPFLAFRTASKRTLAAWLRDSRCVDRI